MEKYQLLLLENYVNRCYIDLLGREPLDDEMIEDVQFLRDNEAKLKVGTSYFINFNSILLFIEGDSSYNQLIL